jgi:hypothetical protein
MRKVKHWLHIVLTILTSGLWLPVYVILLATTEMFNRGYREGKAAGRVARQNEIDEERAIPKSQWVTPPDSRTFNCRCVVKPIPDVNEPQVGADGKIYGYAPKMAERAKSPTMRYLDLCDWRRECNPLPPTLETEYQQLHQEFGQ